MGKQDWKSKFLPLVLTSVLSMAFTLSPAISAKATTDCETAKGAVLKYYDRSGNDPIALVGMKTAVELCFGGCATMIDLYHWSGFETAPWNLRSMVLDSWNTCLLVGDNSGWNQPRPAKYKTNRAPKISGTPIIGKTLVVVWGRWSGDSSWYDQAWFVCKDPKPKAQSWIDQKNISINLPRTDCVQQGSDSNTFKLFPKHRGRFVIVCQYSSSEFFHGVTCSPSVRAA